MKIINEATAKQIQMRSRQTGSRVPRLRRLSESLITVSKHLAAVLLVAGFAANSALGEEAAPPLPLQPKGGVEGITLANECPAADEQEKKAIATAAQQARSASIPVIKGLTWAFTWTKFSQSAPHDYECLQQVTNATDEYIDVTTDCEKDEGKHESAPRRICRQDLMGSHTIHPSVWPDTALVILPTTLSSLSSAALRELKAKGTTPLRWFEVNFGGYPHHPFTFDVNATLYRTATPKTFAIQVNEKLSQLPVIAAQSKKGDFQDVKQDDSGDAFGLLMKAVGGDDDDDPDGTGKYAIRAVILDDERYPMMLSFQVPGESYGLRLTKITYGAEPEMERQLAAQEPVTVYGIYFDFASDRIRSESTPVLEQIAAIMAKNPKWKLSVTGHTDNIGGSASNLDLSKRRAAAVKLALTQRYHIDAARLTTDGSGAGTPQDTNDTPEGRARNRRVVLRRES